MKKTILIITICAALIAAGISLYFACSRAITSHKQALVARRAAWARLKEDTGKLIRGYNGWTAIVIEDLGTGRRIELDKDALIPSASLAKIPVMLAYFAAAEEGKVKFSDRVELKTSDKTGGSGLLKNACPGSDCSVEDLIYLMITESDNTAANILIGRMGLDELNRYFSKFGLKHTNLSRKMMDFHSRKDGVENYTTAGDMAYILEQLYRGRFLNKKASKKCLGLLSEQKINDRIPKRLPADTPVAHKTGLERGVCHDAGIVYTGKGDFLIVVLTKHTSPTARDSKKFISRLALLAYNYYYE